MGYNVKHNKLQVFIATMKYLQQDLVFHYIEFKGNEKFY